MVFLPACMASKLFQMYFFKYLNGYRLHFLGAAAIYWWKIFMTPGNPTQMLLLLFELLKKIRFLREFF